jgi:hypothetical protein
MKGFSVKLLVQIVQVTMVLALIPSCSIGINTELITSCFLIWGDSHPTDRWFMLVDRWFMLVDRWFMLVEDDSTVIHGTGDIQIKKCWWWQQQ